MAHGRHACSSVEVSSKLPGSAACAQVVMAVFSYLYFNSYVAAEAAPRAPPLAPSSFMLCFAG